MSSLKQTERIILEKLLEMNSGYVLNFSDRTFRDFVLENTNIDLYAPGYEVGGTSKANRLRTFWKNESDTIVAKLLEALLDYWKTQKLITSESPQVGSNSASEEYNKIVLRLKGQTESLNNYAPQGLHPGVFIAARNIENDGKISGPRVDVISENYSGKGEISSPPQSNPINITHTNFHFGSGDNIGFLNKIQKSSKDIPLLVKWIVAITSIFALLWGIYVYLYPTVEDNSWYSSATLVSDNGVATSTIQLSVILNKAITYDTVIERQDFLTKYIGDTVIGQGTIKEISRFYDTLLIDIDFNPKDVNCNQEASEENLKTWIPSKGRRIQFIGKFPFTETPEHGLDIHECTLTLL